MALSLIFRPKGTVILSVILPHYQAFYADLADLYRSCVEGRTGSITMIQYGETPGVMAVEVPPSAAVRWHLYRCGL